MIKVKFLSILKNKLILIPILLLSSCHLLGNFIINGSPFRNCSYTEETIPVPKELVNKKVILTRDAVVGIGNDKEYSCLDSFENVARNILHLDSYNYLDYYLSNHGLVLKNLEKGISFKMKEIIAVTKHGLSSIDSGSGPIYHLILEDNTGRLYSLATVYLGDLHLAVEFNAEDNQVKKQKTFKWINSDTFDKSDDDKNSTYAGELASLTEYETEELKKILQK